MRRQILLAGVLVLGIGVIGTGVAAGCGDKFVLVARGARVARSQYPSSILIFMNPSSRVPAAEKEFHVEATLKAAGHKAVVAESEAEVQKALASGKYDLVLADAADVPALRKEATASSSKPVVLPLLYKPTAGELAAAEKEANCMVRASNKSRDLLVVVDETMKGRRAGVAAICDTTTP
jgi:hypothetical protein